jgi:hypothetical protein
MLALCNPRFLAAAALFLYRFAFSPVIFDVSVAIGVF